MSHFDAPSPWASNPEKALADAVEREKHARLKRAERARERAARGEAPPEVAKNLAAICFECAQTGDVVSARAKELCGKHYHRAWRGERRDPTRRVVDLR